MTAFDRYLMADWSASNTPKRGKDSIWIGTAAAEGDVTLTNPATRAEAYGLILNEVREAEARGHRLLLGFDFAFGYPSGTAERFGGWQGLWAAIAELEDNPDNSNNRFELAARLNSHFEGDGPFWCYPHQHHGRYPGLPFHCPKEAYGRSLPPRKRRAEEAAPGAQEVWKLTGAGAVGSQALTGIAMLERLRRETSAKIWPFETLGEAQITVAEIFPSLHEPDPSEEIRDAGQVRATINALRMPYACPPLSSHLSAPRFAPPEVIAEEGWILGAPLPRMPRKVTRKMTYERDPAAIYAASFATVEAEAGLSRFPNEMKPIVTRLVHACGMPEIADRIAFSEDAATAGIAALQKNAVILTDCEMVRAGITEKFLPATRTRCTLNDPRTPGLAKSLATTRSAAAVELWEEHLAGAIVAIGNAPTTLYHLLEKLDEGWPKPALILGFPVGFIGAAESKAELARDPRETPFIALRGRRGGSALASAAVNALAAMALPDLRLPEAPNTAATHSSESTIQ